MSGPGVAMVRPDGDSAGCGRGLITNWPQWPGGRDNSSQDPHISFLAVRRVLGAQLA